MNPELLPKPDAKLDLHQVTLSAVTSVNIQATLRALETCLDQADFAECLLFTDAQVDELHADIRIVPIPRLTTSAAYSHFVLESLVDHIKTTHCLIVQWDGHIINKARWKPEFLEYDYIGASWPQFDDGHDVGNGGFSLRSRRLMEAFREPGFNAFHPEDVAIGRTNRKWLEDRGMRFAPRVIADLFASERSGSLNNSFGYHGVFNMPHVLGLENFWSIYETLDNRSNLKPDLLPILVSFRSSRKFIRRAARLISDYMMDVSRRVIS